MSLPPSSSNPSFRPDSAFSGAAMDRPVRRSRRKTAIRATLAAVAVIVLGASAALLLGRAGSDTLVVSRAGLSTAPAVIAPFQDVLPVRATIVPATTVVITATQPGIVAKVEATEGALVTQGQVLAVLSNPQVELEVRSREAAIAGQLASASAQRLSVQQALTADDTALAEASYNRLRADRELGIRRQLLEQGFMSPAGLKGFADEAAYYRSRLTILKAANGRDRAAAAVQLKEIDRSITELQSGLRDLTGSLGQLVLRAPGSGRLTNFSLQPGETVTAGASAGHIDSATSWRLEAEVDEYYLQRVAIGQHASGEIAGTPFTASLRLVKPQIANGVFRISLDFDGAPPAGLRRGQDVECRLTLAAAQNALVLPAGGWLTSLGGHSIFVVSADGGRAVRRPVAIGRRNPEQVEILSGILQGETAIVSDLGDAGKFKTLELR